MNPSESTPRRRSLLWFAGAALGSLVVASPFVFLGTRGLQAEEPVGYVGSKKCKKCHQKIHKAFMNDNKMAKALETLKPEELLKKDDIANSGKYCIECHVTGFGRTGGFELPADAEAAKKCLGDEKLMESVGHVGCESCHGPGSAHVDQNKEALKDLFEAGKDTGILRRKPNACVECHNPHVSHKRGAEIKGEWTKDRGPSTASLEGATYIGADECKSCHEKQYETWSKTKHASNFSILKADEYDKEDDAAEIEFRKPLPKKKCIECHVTGYGKPGGFTSAADEHSKKLTNTQCEACHGPGSLHKQMADQYKSDGKDLKGVKDQKINRVPQDACRECHMPHVNHKEKYPGRRKE